MLPKWSTKAVTTMCSSIYLSVEIALNTKLLDALDCYNPSQYPTRMIQYMPYAAKHPCSLCAVFIQLTRCALACMSLLKFPLDATSVDPLINCPLYQYQG
jgi:hypothetical protein